MLQLDHITKIYPSGNVTALKNVSVSFRKNEFVSVLGPSGCGKTTLLNIIGGLDRYTSGELKIRHVPTARYNDRDWDTYRNHSVGFVFQSYNLIPHQSILANVELALTLSGVSKAERRQRAKDALLAVGLGDQLKKRPSQLSGGQMQRVAIARALVNDPELLLADEPTGALDSETSVQVMEILKNVAKDRLVIMVTHNPELAERYSSRILRFLDGEMLSDSNPYTAEEEDAETYDSDVSPASEDGAASFAKPAKKEKRRTSMSFFTALSLSLNNLMTKKTRTLLTAFGGSIGIIGIALILSLSNGINLYISRVQEDTLSAYPILINAETMDISSVLTTMSEARRDSDGEEWVDDGIIRSNTVTLDTFKAMGSLDVQKNNLSRFMDYIKEHGGDFDGKASAVSYGYSVPLTLYSVSETNADGIPVQINPSSLFSAGFRGQSGSRGGTGAFSGLAVWEEMIDNPELMEKQYSLVAGKWPSEWNEVVLAVDEHNRINDLYLYALGIKDSAEFYRIMEAAFKGEDVEIQSDSYTCDELLGREFALILPSSLWQKEEGGEAWKYMGDNASFMKLALENSERLSIVGIIRPNPEAVATSLNGAVGYLPSLTRHILDESDAAAVILAQKENPDVDILCGLPFATDDFNEDSLTVSEKADAIRSALQKMTTADQAAAYTNSITSLSDEDAAEMAAAQLSSLPAAALRPMLEKTIAEQSGMDEATVKAYLDGLSEEEKEALATQIVSAQIKASYEEDAAARLGSMTQDELAAALTASLSAMDDETTAKVFADYMPPVVSERTLEETLRELGSVDRSAPDSIRIYSETFKEKDGIAAMIQAYNNLATDEKREEDVIHYTDYVALLMSSVSTIINVISYVLIAFVSISLVVSSIMIGIITYISVLERTKEIGILRAIGASKKDISRVFNAETLIVGFAAGTLGILITLLILIPVNVIIAHLTDIGHLARLPVQGGIALVVISMFLTMLSGLIPSGMAARKDPVEALRNE